MYKSMNIQLIFSQSWIHVKSSIDHDQTGVSMMKMMVIQSQIQTSFGRTINDNKRNNLINSTGNKRILK